MSARFIEKSVLLKTSSNTDVQNGGGYLAITGLESVPKKDIASIYQIKYRAEVPQVVTLFGTTYTPVASTVYQVAIYDPLRVDAGYQEAPKYYSYTTPAVITTIGANAALQSEYIHGQLIIAINNDATNHCTAVTVGGGNGITVTDDGGYYPAKAQNMTNVKGPNTVIPITNSDGTGFAATNYVITTAAVFSSGVGARLLQDAPVVDFTYGNLIAGTFKAPATATNPPTYATSGQNYDIFGISSVKLVPGTTLTEQYVYQMQEQYAVVDNGTGSSTTNLTGFKSFERALLSNLFQLYRNDIATIYTMGDTAAVSQGLGTGLPSGTAQAENVVSFGNGFTAHYSPIATSTLLALVSTNDGLGLVLDATAAEGVELSAPTWANSQKSFVVGKTAFSCYAKITLDDASGVNPLWVGFRKKAAYGATFTAYSDYAVIGVGSSAGQIYTNTEKNGAGNTATDTTVVWADATTRVLEVRVDIAGVVTFFIDGYKPTVTQAFTLDAGDEMIACIYALQSADLATPSLLEWAAIPSDTWRS